MTSPWQELGIAATNDQGVIRRAYATRLKATNAENDRDGFMRLRAAYEAAMTLARQTAADDERQPVPLVETPEMEKAVTAAAADSSEAGAASLIEPIVEDAGSVAVRTDIVASLAARDPVTAASLLRRAIAERALPLADELALSDQLLVVLVANPDVTGDQLIEIAQDFGWYGVAAVSQAKNPLALQRLGARIDAELWLRALRRDAAHPAFFVGGTKAAAARLLIGRGPILLSWLLPPNPPLYDHLVKLSLHQGWIAQHFKQARVQQASRVLKSRLAKFPGITFAVIWLAIGAVGGELLPALAGISRVWALLFLCFLFFRRMRPGSWIKWARPAFVASIAILIVEAGLDALTSATEPPPRPAASHRAAHKRPQSSTCATTPNDPAGAVACSSAPDVKPERTATPSDRR